MIQEFTHSNVYKLLFLLSTFIFLYSCDQNQSEVAAPPPPDVTVSKPLIQDVTEWDEYTGRLQAVDEVEIRSRVSGYLESINFRDGEIVEEGQLLFLIDPRPYQAVLDQNKAALTRAQVRLKLAKNDLNRAQRLFKSRAISEEELDSRTQEERQAVAALEEAKAAVNAAELDVEFTQIKSPIKGRIGRNLIDIGNIVSGGSAESTLLATIVSLDPIHFYFTADERAFLKYVRLAKEGSRPSSRTTANPVQLELADEDGFPHHGVMDFVDNRVDEATGTMQARAIFENPDLLLTPGLFAKVRLLGKGPYKATLLPDASILSDQSIKFVYVLNSESNTVDRREIELGRAFHNLRVITKGINENDLVVINGIQRVRVGSKVNPNDGSIPGFESIQPNSASTESS